ncbi:MAG: CHASE2 domain-containing protein [Solirubrobacterales bacterium]
MAGTRSIRALLLAGLLAASLGGVVYLSGALGSLERDSIALRYELRDEPTPRDVAVVGIDAGTFADLKTRWPFPRSLHAAMVDRLHAAGAREIVYDVQFTEPTTPKEDLALYGSIARAGGAVLATGETRADGSTNVLGGDERLARIDAEAGSARFDNDRGGVVARVPYEVNGLKTLAVVTAQRITGRPVSRSGFGDRGAWIDYRGGPGTIPTYSFADVLRQRTAPAALRDKIVVVGATSPVLQDVHATPTSGSELMAGPEVEANAIWTVLHGTPLRTAPAPLDLLLIVLLAAAAPMARLRLGVLAATGVGLAAGAIYVVTAQLAFNDGWILTVVPPLVAVVAGTVAMVAVSELRERFERLRVAQVNELLEQRVRERTEELHETQLEIIRRLSQAAESRDEITGRHIGRIGTLCGRLARAAGMSEERAEMLRYASALHDVGKIGMPDSVLLKPGRLDEGEWAKMRSHPEIGAEILAGSRSPVVELGRTIALTHHERWDGSGYPAGLAGEEIPLEGRICAVCDVFDALLTERPYKQPWPLEDVIAEIRSQSGRHFDPRLVGLFLPMAAQLHTELGYDVSPKPGPAFPIAERETPAGASQSEQRTPVGVG